MEDEYSSLSSKEGLDTKGNREDETDKRNNREKKSNIWQTIQCRRQEKEE